MYELTKVRRAPLFLAALLFAAGAAGPRSYAAAPVVRSVPANAGSSYATAVGGVLQKMDAARLGAAADFGVSLNSELPRLRKIILRPGARRSATLILEEQLRPIIPSGELFEALPERDREIALADALARVIARERARARGIGHSAADGSLDEAGLQSAYSRSNRFILKGYIHFLGEKDRRGVLDARDRLRERLAKSRANGIAESISRIGGALTGASDDLQRKPRSQKMKMTPGRIAALRSFLVDSRETALYSEKGFDEIGGLSDYLQKSGHLDHLHSSAGFDAVVAGDPAELAVLEENLRAQPDMIQGLLNIMYYSVVRIARGELPAGKRRELLGALIGRYDALLTRLRSDSSFPVEVRAAAGRASSRYLRSGVLLEVLDAERKAQGTALKVRRKLIALAPSGSVESKTREDLPDWTIPEPFAPETLITGKDVRGETETSLASHISAIDDAWKTLRRAARARPGTRAKRVQEFIRDYLPWFDYAVHMVGRFAWVTMNMDFAGFQPRPLIGAADSPGLRLIPEKGGFLLKAKFDTDIQNPRVIRVVRESIESYWRGKFKLKGKTRDFRTEVDIRRLEPGEDFSADRLRLVDGKNNHTHAAGVQLVMGRDPNNFDFGVPAHEFGHVLGLIDDYSEAFVLKSRSRRETRIEGSLMGGRMGVVLPRHLELVTLMMFENDSVGEARPPLLRGPPDELPEKTRGALKNLETELAKARPSESEAYQQIRRLWPSEENPLSAGRQNTLAAELLKLLPKVPYDLSYWHVELIETLGRSGSEAYSAVMDAFIRTYSKKINPWSRFKISRRLIRAAEHGYRVELLAALAKRLDFNAADPQVHLSLVGRLPRSSFEDAELIMSALGVLSAGDDALRQSIETEIVKRTFEDQSRKLPNLKPVGRGGRWFKGQKARVRKEMPTLMGILEDSDAAGRFMSTLAYLRMLDPYYKANRAFKPTLQWAREHDELIALNELRIAPVSESFRRMLITNVSGSLTLEIKFPGQMGGRMRLHPKEFIIAQWLWRNFPDDPGVVKPVYTGRLSGKLRLYGKIKKFLPEKPLVFTIFEYEDGKRFSNADNMLSAIARKLRTTKKRLIHRIRVDMAVAAIRLHRAGWLGSVGGNDMHPENIKVLRDGRGVLVADFLAFTRHREPSLRARQGDLRGLLSDYLAERDPAGSEPERYEPAQDERMAAIYSDVVERLTRGIRGRARRGEIAEEVRREFALKRAPGGARPPRLLISGPPGSGKSTQAKLLAKGLGVVHITVGGLLREYAGKHPKILEQMNSGKLVDTGLVLRLVRERLAQDDVKERGFILDGFPRREVEAKELDNLLGEEDTIDGMIRLEVPKEELLRRILKRGRADDTEEVFQERMKIYREETVPVIEGLATGVPTLGPKSAVGRVGKIYGEIGSGLGKLLGRTGS